MTSFNHLRELYAKDIDRKFNPAVNASDFKPETVNVEIDEYVFTDELINSIYDVLHNIRDRQTAHNGIWINGYFGSGKSHFLKFLNYCLHPAYSERAMSKFTEAVRDHDPLQDPQSRCDVTVADAESLASWLRGATVETTLFNIGSVANSNTNTQRVFTEVFWHELNRHRGYNTFNLPLAQYLEKALDEKGKLQEFRDRLDDEFGWDWATMAAELANTEIDTVLEVAKDVAPSLSTDVIRERILRNDFPLSVEAFMNELRAFVANKPDNFRFIFFADEISQFINNSGSMLLTLQQIVSDLHEACDGKVWIACTAQQDLSELIGECRLSQATDDIGKIMGRFQVKVSLKGTNSEYITQKRILEKKGSAAMELEQAFDTIHSNISAQLLLPTGYNIYRSRQEFAAYYPFVPYQFTLMMHIFDAFVAQGFVDKEVKGNERSIIKITHSVAKDTKDQPVGPLVSFDQFYNAMFRGSLTAKGQKAIAMANNVIQEYHTNRDLAQRVVNLLFMICNMDEQQRRVFPATTDHVTSLLMRDVDDNKLQLKAQVQDIVNYLCDKNILRRDVLADGHTEFYSFFTEEERNIAQAIKNQYVDNDFMLNMLIDFFKTYLAPRNRESFGSSHFSIGGAVNGKTFLNSNADILVEFVLESTGSVHDFAFRNPNPRLAFYMADGFAADPDLRDALAWVCKASKYVNSPEHSGGSDVRKAALDKFRQRAQELYASVQKTLKDIFNAAPVISGTSIINIAPATRDKTRYDEAMHTHLKNVYQYAELATGSSVPRTEAELKAKVQRPSEPGEYSGVNANLSLPEEEINNFITSRGGEVNLQDIVRHFQKAPYGWSQMATLFFTNELVRRNVREYTFNNAENPSRAVVAANITRETGRFMVKASKVVPPEVLSAFKKAWTDIFMEANTPSTSHPADLHAWAKDRLHTNVSNTNTEVIARLGAESPVVPKVQQAIDMMQQWLAIRDDEQFFRRVAADCDIAKQLMDTVKRVREFVGNDRMFGAYRCFLTFVRDNRDNWDALPESCRPDINGLQTIATEPWPIDKMNHYKRMHRALDHALDELRRSLRQQIEEKLRSQDSELTAFAADKGVPYASSVESEITRATSSSNISTLKNNLLSDDWRAKQVERINAAIPTPPPVIIDGGSGGGEGTPPPAPPRKVVKRLRLRTSTLSNLKSMDDVNAYLARLRQQIIDELGNADELQIL